MDQNISNSDIREDTIYNQSSESDLDTYIEVGQKTPYPIIYFDPEGQIRDINSAAKDFLGISISSDLRSYNLFTDPLITSEKVKHIQNGKEVSGLYFLEQNLNNKLPKMYKTFLILSNHVRNPPKFEYIIYPLLSSIKKIEGYIFYLKPFPEKQPNHVLISEKKIELDRLISRINFLFLGMDDLNPLINPLLKEITDFTQCDYTYLTLFLKEEESCLEVYEWDHLQTQIRYFKSHEHILSHKFCYRLQRGLKLDFTKNLSVFSQHSHKRKPSPSIRIHKRNFNSMIAYPILGKFEITGWIGVANLKSAEYKQEVKTLLHLVSDLIANYLEKKRVTRIARERDIFQKHLEYNHEFIEKSKAIGIMTGGLAHDFKNLLTGVIGNIQLAKLENDKNHELIQLLNDAEQASLQANELANQLLKFTKTNIELNENINLGTLVKKIAQFTVRGSKCYCFFEVENDLWPILGNRNQLNQVFNNIILNAIQAMPVGGKITILINNIQIKRDSPLNLPPGKYVRIIIADQGIGMDSNTLNKIFEPYYTTKRNGSGLGLHNVQRIVKRHHGYIKIKSSKFIGTSFQIYFPKKIPSNEIKI